MKYIASIPKRNLGLIEVIMTWYWNKCKIMSTSVMKLLKPLCLKSLEIDLAKEWLSQCLIK